MVLLLHPAPGRRRWVSLDRVGAHHFSADVIAQPGRAAPAGLSARLGLPPRRRRCASQGSAQLDRAWRSVCLPAGYGVELSRLATRCSLRAPRALGRSAPSRY